jgi:hypothetical protein
VSPPVGRSNGDHQPLAGWLDCPPTPEMPRNERVYAAFNPALVKLVGKILSELRIERGLSLSQSGMLGGFYGDNLAKHERGERPLSVSRLRSYLVAYGVSWEEFGERLHRLDMIWPRDIDHTELNRLRRAREAGHLNRFTGRPAITCRANGQSSGEIVARRIDATMATFHSWCRRQLRRSPVVPRKACVPSTRGAE